MFYLTGFLRTENSLKNEGRGYNPYFSGRGKKFITPISTDNIITLKDNTASVQFTLYYHFGARVGLCGDCGIVIHEIDLNSLRLVQSLDRIDGFPPQVLTNIYGGRTINLEMPLVKKDMVLI